ncbi:hypothetical protein KZ813_16865 [Sphingomonas sp. RHCKR7]|uniref:hypothetical protein n=1 Tax=Sphingomonas folli TaxID=2862497 RepID=UPI001CA4C649|nr:hypothetical protein [Sphingomonas folli]MBW6528516.1 hypothetical protein [Sphingomonas folli]
MAVIRQHLLARGCLAVLLIALTLAMRLVVPGGYAPDVAGGEVRLAVCTPGGPQVLPVSVPEFRQRGSVSDDVARPSGACAFTALRSAYGSAVDPCLLAAAIAFIIAISIFWVPLGALAESRRLRPPLRGPPLHA